MSLILHINTAQEEASVALSNNDKVLFEEHNKDQMQHASFLQPAIQKIIHNSKFKIQNLDAITVIAGPGSYTGSRVGLASAKGLCYALGIPLITLNTLEVMAYAAIHQSTHQPNSSTLYCPMIDARRNEVFTAVYDSKMNVIMQPSAIILDENSFIELRKSHELVVFGSGSVKWNNICKNHNMINTPMLNMILAQNILAYNCFQKQQFTDIAYVEPFYIKEFYTPALKKE